MVKDNFYSTSQVADKIQKDFRTYSSMVPLGGTVDIDTLRETKTWSVSTSSEIVSPNLPWNGLNQIISVYANSNGTITYQEALLLTGARRNSKAWRGRWAGAWSKWTYVSDRNFETALLGSGVDFNTVRTQGVYGTQFLGHPNSPVNKIGTLEVLPASALCTQRFTSWETPNRTFIRRATSASDWSDWEELPSSSELRALGSRVGSLEGQAGSGGGSSNSSVPRGAISATTPEVTVKPSSQMVGAMTDDRTRVYTFLGNPPKYSDDDGDTWVDLPLVPGGVAVESTMIMDNGELLVTGLIGSISRRAVWVSQGNGTASMSWTKVLEAPYAGIKFTQAWSQSKHGRMIFINEYGPKAGMAWPGVTGDVPRGEAAVRSYMSMDYGKTFKVIFNLHDWVTTAGGRTNSDMQHLHGIAWDPYWDRIWITYGDGMGGKGSNGIVFSDDLGTTWNFAYHTPEGGTSTAQMVGILPMPKVIMFFGDTTNAVERIDRSEGKKKSMYNLVTAYSSTAVGAPKHLCQGYYRGTRVGDDAPALMAFCAEGAAAEDFVVATMDGINFAEIWRSPVTSPAGYGVRSVIGPTVSGNFLVSTNANGGVAGEWAMMKIPATGY